MLCQFKAHHHLHKSGVATIGYCFVLHFVAYKPLTLFNTSKQPQGVSQQNADAAEEEDSDVQYVGANYVESPDEQTTEDESPQPPLMILSHLYFFFKAGRLLQHFHLDSPRTPTKDHCAAVHRCHERDLAEGALARFQNWMGRWYQICK